MFKHKQLGGIIVLPMPHKCFLIYMYNSLLLFKKKPVAFYTCICSGCSNDILMIFFLSSNKLMKKHTHWLSLRCCNIQACGSIENISMFSVAAISSRAGELTKGFPWPTSPIRSCSKSSLITQYIHKSVLLYSDQRLLNVVINNIY